MPWPLIIARGGLALRMPCSSIDNGGPVHEPSIAAVVGPEASSGSKCVLIGPSDGETGAWTH